MALYTSDGTGDVQVGSAASSGMYPNHSSLTVALTLKVTGTFSSRRIATWWGNGNSEQGWLLGASATDEIAFLTQDGGAYYGRQTTDLDVVNGGLYRIVCTFLGSGVGGMETKIWVNGVSRTVEMVVGNSSFAEFDGAELNVTQIGREQDENVAGVVGEYSEWAMWSAKVPDWVAEAYGKGMSPRFYRTNGMVYIPGLVNGTHRDEFLGQQVTVTSMAAAAHPSVLYPTHPQVTRSATPAPTAKIRRTLTALGTRMGSRQLHGG